MSLRVPNWLYCRVADVTGYWPPLRRLWDRICFGPMPGPDPEDQG